MKRTYDSSEELHKKVRRGFEQIERGEYTVYTYATEIADKIKAEGRKRSAGIKTSEEGTA